MPNACGGGAPSAVHAICSQIPPNERVSFGDFFIKKVTENYIILSSLFRAQSATSWPNNRVARSPREPRTSVVRDAQAAQDALAVVVRAEPSES